MNIKEIATTLAFLGTGSLVAMGCGKEPAPATEVPGGTDAPAADAAAAEASCGEGHTEEGHCSGSDPGEGEGEGSCSGEKAEGEGSCSGEKAEGEGSCSGK